MAKLKQRKYRLAHRLISFLRDRDVRGVRRLSVSLPKLLLPDPKKVGPHILRTIHGFPMKIDPSRDTGVELSLFQTGTYEKGTLAVLQDLLKHGDCFIDVGANIGLMSVFAAQCVGRTGEIIAFEAHPETYDLLLYNVDINKLTNVKTYAFALGDEDTTAMIYDDHEVNRGGASLVAGEDVTRGHEVQVKRLDDVLSGEIAPAVMKVDVEGYELQVLKGASGMIERTKPALIVEFSAARSNRYDPQELLEYIRSFGFYELYKLSGTKERKSGLVKILSDADLPEHDNLFCLVKGGEAPIQ